MADRFDFPDCMHCLAAALHKQGIDPASVTIELPCEQWWNLQCALERHIPGLMRYDGRETVTDEFKYMGFRFRASPQQVRA